MIPALVPKSRVVATPDQLSSELSGEVVILSLADSAYYGLDAVGAQIWRSLAQPRTVAELVTGVMNRYAVEHTQCERDVIAFLEELRAHQLIAIVEGDPA